MVPPKPDVPKLMDAADFAAAVAAAEREAAAAAVQREVTAAKTAAEASAKPRSWSIHDVLGLKPPSSPGGTKSPAEQSSAMASTAVGAAPHTPSAVSDAVPAVAAGPSGTPAGASIAQAQTPISGRGFQVKTPHLASSSPAPTIPVVPAAKNTDRSQDPSEDLSAREEGPAVAGSKAPGSSSTGDGVTTATSPRGVVQPAVPPARSPGASAEASLIGFRHAISKLAEAVKIVVSKREAESRRVLEPVVDSLEKALSAARQKGSIEPARSDELQRDFNAIRDELKDASQNDSVVVDVDHSLAVGGAAEGDGLGQSAADSGPGGGGGGAGAEGRKPTAAPPGEPLPSLHTVRDFDV